MPLPKENCAYFRVTYPDRERMFPIVETFVYLGLNLSDDDKDDTYYFQPASDYVRHGHAATADVDERPVICVGSEELNEMMDFERVVALLDSIKHRQAQTT